MGPNAAPPFFVFGYGSTYGFVVLCSPTSYRPTTAMLLRLVTGWKLLGKRRQPANGLHTRPPYKSGCTIDAHCISTLAYNSLALWPSTESVEYRQFLLPTLSTTFGIDLLRPYGCGHSLAVLTGRLLDSKSLSGI